MTMTTYGLAISAIILLFDIVNWFYYYLSDSLVKKERRSFIGIGYLNGYMPLLIACSIIIAIFVSKDVWYVGKRLDSIGNAIIAICFLSQVVYIFFFRPKLIIKGLNRED